jgi:hypothetical protein
MRMCDHQMMESNPISNFMCLVYRQTDRDDHDRDGDDGDGGSNGIQ